MATEKFLRNLRSIFASEDHLQELEIEVGLLSHFEEEKTPSPQPQHRPSTLLTVLCTLLRVLVTKTSSLFRRHTSTFLASEWYFTPSELLPAWHPSSLSPPARLHPTSWLDGLRGVAALIVFFHHYSQIWLPGLRPGWGSSSSANHILQLPVVRILFSGGAMVSIFFVVSGYVLSTKPLRLIHEGKNEELLANLASSTFRRGPRLFVPCVASTFITALLAMMGAFVDEGVARHYPREGTLWAQMASWAHETAWFVNPRAEGTGFEPNLWTIPTEFSGSLLVFLCVLGLSRVRDVVRLGCLVGLIMYWLWFGYWMTILFLGGVLLADIQHHRCESPSKDPSTGLKSRRDKILQWLLVFLALFLLSMPEYDEAVTESYGYATLSTSLTPPSWHNHWGPGRWWPCLSSLMLVAIIDHAGSESIIQRCFTWRFPQYLGRISFSLYLCHGMMLYSLGLRVTNLCFFLFGRKSTFRYGFSLSIGTCVFVPVLFWVSDVFTVVVDRGAVVLSRSLMKL